MAATAQRVAVDCPQSTGSPVAVSGASVATPCRVLLAEPAPSPSIVRVALRLPSASGVKLTATGQGAPGFRVTPEQWSPVTAKAVTSPPLSETARTFSGALPVLATVTVRAAPEEPTGWGSKATAPGLSPSSCAGRF